MVRFILQEADEKASEISVAAEEVGTDSLVFTTCIPTYLDLYACMHAGVQHREAAAGGVGKTEGAAGVRAQGEAGGRPQEDVSRRSIHSFVSSISSFFSFTDANSTRPCMHACSEYSTELNAARIKLLRAQDDVVTGMKESAGDALLRVTKDANAYKRVLKGLIVQSLLRLREPALVLRCREADRSLVEAVLEVAKKEYAEKAKVNLPKIIIDGKVYLPPQRTSRDAHGPSWYSLAHVTSRNLS
jgi:hypothetical protein